MKAIRKICGVRNLDRLREEIALSGADYAVLRLSDGRSVAERREVRALVADAIRCALMAYDELRECGTADGECRGN